MIAFSTYLYLHTFYTSKPLEEITFGGYSFPYYNRVRSRLEKELNHYPSLPLRKGELTRFLAVHTESYLKSLCLTALDKPLPPECKPLRESAECQGLEFCLPGYQYGLGGMMEAIDQMRKGKIERAYCFSMVGHHAHADWGHGYCLLNPQAAAVRYAQSQGFTRVLIIDWDIHHGDGTQSIFSHDPNTYCISIHSAVDLYMAKASDLTEGTTTVARRVGHCNIPIIPKDFPTESLYKLGLTGEYYTGNDSLTIFAESLRQLPWSPDLITIFSGYDSHRGDCGEKTTGWTNEDFCELTRLAIDLATGNGCPILSVHGGGYKIDVTVSAAIAHVNMLATYE